MAVTNDIIFTTSMGLCLCSNAQVSLPVKQTNLRAFGLLISRCLSFPIGKMSMTTSLTQQLCRQMNASWYSELRTKSFTPRSWQLEDCRTWQCTEGCTCAHTNSLQRVNPCRSILSPCCCLAHTPLILYFLLCLCRT